MVELGSVYKNEFMNKSKLIKFLSGKLLFILQKPSSNISSSWQISLPISRQSPWSLFQVLFPGFPQYPFVWKGDVCAVHSPKFEDLFFQCSMKVLD